MLKITLFILLSVILLILVRWYTGGRQYQYIGIPELTGIIPTHETTLPPERDLFIPSPLYTNESKGERRCREVFEHLFQRRFDRVRPEFLINPHTGRRMELDGFCGSLRLAFEYNGIQHRKDKDVKKLLLQVRRDHIKIDICDKRNIHLITITDTVPFNDIGDFILASIPDSVKPYMKNQKMSGM